MAQYPQIVIKHNIGNTIEIPNQLDIKIATYLGNNYNAGVTSLLSDNATGFSSSNILLLLSSLGAQNAEIVTSSSHTSTTFTTGTTIQPHNRGENISELKYDQIVISKSATIGGTYTVLATQTFQVTQQSTIVFDATGLSTDYYKIQWKNSISGLLSSFSDPISVLSYPENSVASIIYPVLKAMGISENDTKINTEFLISAVDDARKYTQGKLFGIRHDWLQEFEYPIKLLAGTNYVTLPDNIDFKETDRSLLCARFIFDNFITPYPLTYVDKRAWNNLSFSAFGGTTTAQVSIGGATITLSSTGDFADSGVAYVATTGYTQTIMQIQYTGNNRTTNTLSGVTGVIRIIPTGTQVWQNPSINQPTFYTVYDNKIIFDRIIPDSIQGRNIYIDYYKKIEEIINLYQVLSEPYREIYKWYLRYAVKYRKDIALGNDDPDLKKFEGLVLALFNNLYTGQSSIIIT